MIRFERVAASTACMLAFVLLSACGREPVHDPSAGLSNEAAVALIDRAPRSEVALQDLVEAYALGSKSTQAQREALTQGALGHTVEWDLPVSDVSIAEERFQLSTSAIATRNRAEAVPMLRVVAFVVARGASDEQRLLRLRTDETVRIRGIVQEVRDQRAVAIVPAVLVP